MSMKDLFKQDERLLEIRQKLQDAMTENDSDKFREAFEEVLQYYAGAVRQDFEDLRQEKDAQVLSARGVRQLTSKERTYYQKLGEAMRARDPKQAINNLDVVMPETVIDSIFEDLRTDHPLLSRITFIYTNASVRMLMNTNGYQEAQWGELCDDIVKELFSGFKEVDAGLLKLSAFIPVCKAMLDLGPEWLDRYIRQIMMEALANGLERGIVAGDGKTMPIGMNRQVGEGVTVTDGVYPEKKKITVTDFSPSTVGNLISMLAAGPKGTPRRVSGVILVVNPQDYFQKIMPATTIMGPDGTYRNDVLPYPMTVIQSAAKSRGSATIGIASLYWAFAGMNRDGRIEYSDHYRFLEDERVYLIKTYANGLPADNNAFMELDISGLKPASYKVTLVEEGAPSSDAALSDLRIGALSLSPAFSAGTTSYTAATSNVTNTITAVPANAASTVELEVNGAAADNGTAPTWNSGTNTVRITVTAADGETSKVYTVTVTKSSV